MVDDILGAHPKNDDIWDNTNPTDVYIDTLNSEEKMAGSHITKFHTHKDEQPVIADLLSQEDQDYDNQHNTGQGHHNLKNLQSNTSVDCKLATGEN